MVALLSHKKITPKKNDEFYLSYIPTEACHGFRLIKTIGVEDTKIFYRNPQGHLRMFQQVKSPGADGFKDSDPPPGDMDLSIMGPISRSPEDLANWRSGLQAEIEGMPNDEGVNKVKKERARQILAEAEKKFNAPVEKSAMPIVGFLNDVPPGWSFTVSRGFADLVFIKLAYALVRSRWCEGSNPPVNNNIIPAQGMILPVDKRLPDGNNVGAVMVDESNSLIAWGVNCKEENSCFHAETAMVLKYLNTMGVARLPMGIRIYTSLEPCHMCAGMISTFGQNIEVMYGQKDPNVLNNALSRTTKVNNCIQYERENKRSRDLNGAIGVQNAIHFLATEDARGIYDKLVDDLQGMSHVLKEKEIPLDITSESAFGKYNLDLPLKYLRERSISGNKIKTEPSKEKELLFRCMDLLKNLHTSGLIEKPADILSLFDK